MVNRVSIKCSTCGQIHTLRISVGHNPYQEHHFSCAKCSETIIIRLNVNLREINTELMLVENCEVSQSEGIIINLHPEFAVPKDQLHKDRVFPWLKDSHRIINEQQKWIPENADDKRPKNYKEYRELILSLQSTIDGWMKLKKGWSLELNGQNDLAEKKFKEYKAPNFTEKPTLENILLHFSSMYLAPGQLKIFQSIHDFCVHLSQQNNFGFSEFQTYYRETLKADHMYRYFEIFSEYFKYFSEYNQLIIYEKYNVPIPGGHTLTSSAFKHTKMFYGNAFEALTSNFTVLACLGNVYAGRRFDTFEKMDLKIYLSINKANRAKPFENIMEFNSFVACIDSTLRNASHHGSMQINTNNIISYRSGGTGALRKISYLEYIQKCNTIMFNIVSLLMLELTLAYSA